MLAPSVHNTQPWRFVITSGGLDFRVDHSRQLAVLDPTARQLYLSAGSALFNARASLAASGCPSTVRRFPNPEHPDLVARIEVGGDAEIDPMLAALDAVVELRQTNRRRFAEDTVPAELVATLVRAAQAEGALLHPVVKVDDRQTLARLSQKADAEQMASPAYRAELRAWTSNDPARLDGVRAAAVPHVDGSADDDVPIRDFDSQGAGWLPGETHSSASQCLLVLGTDADTPEAWLRAGRPLSGSGSRSPAPASSPACSPRSSRSPPSASSSATSYASACIRTWSFGSAGHRSPPRPCADTSATSSTIAPAIGSPVE